MPEYPGTYLVRWCYNLPQGYGLALAHLYLIVTAGDMTPMFLEGDAIWREFSARMGREDVPVRMAARCVSAVATMSFMLECLSQGMEGPARGFPAGAAGVAPERMAAETWTEIARSCGELSARLCGPAQVAQWLAGALAPAGGLPEPRS